MLACVPVLQGDLITPADLCFLKTICKSCTSKNPTNKKKQGTIFFSFQQLFTAVKYCDEVRGGGKATTAVPSSV